MSDRFSGGGTIRTVHAIAAQCELTDEARALLGAGGTPRAFLERLLEQELYGDAICFLAQALPKRLAVWWGCECTWFMARPDPPEPVLTALQAAVRWALDPTEANRRAAEGPGEADNAETPAGCLALAALWSGGSMLAAEYPVVPPPADLTGRLVAGAIQLAAVEREAPQFREHYRQFLALGLELARGLPLWAVGAAADSDGADDEAERGSELDGLEAGPAVAANGAAAGSPEEVTGCVAVS